MTASQHLRAIHEQVNHPVAPTFVRTQDLIRALPALITAIAAAEEHDSHEDTETFEYRLVRAQLHQALAALREQLEANA